jgi:ferredoxin
MPPRTPPGNRARFATSPLRFFERSRHESDKKMRPVLTVNPIACQAYGYCAELLPEVITLDEWGYPMIAGNPVPAHLVALAQLAAKDCPRRALLLERADDR